MSIISFFILSFFVELVFLSVCLFVFIMRRSYFCFSVRRIVRVKKQINEIISRMINEPSSFPLPKFPLALRSPEILISVLKDLDGQMEGVRWENLKITFMEKWVLRDSRNWTQSSFWEKRYLAAQSFYLHSTVEDFSNVFSLVKDSNFLVQTEAAKAAVKQKNHQAIEYLLQNMGSWSFYTYVYFRDIFLKEGREIFSYIEEVLRSSKSLQVQLTCLDVLSKGHFPIARQMLERDFISSHVSLRLGVVSFHAHNPGEGSEEILSKALLDPVNEVRKEACYGLRSFPSEKNQQKLKKALSDESFDVCLEAAISLFKMGLSGQKILLEELRSHDTRNSRIASYVLYVKQGI